GNSPRYAVPMTSHNLTPRSCRSPNTIDPITSTLTVAWPEKRSTHLLLLPKSRTLFLRLRASVDTLVRTFQAIPPWDQL
ncbi:MAG: hypothetical protein ABF617_14195, partial [Gluconobacter japonicus]|uniref:hypothetical protein n=1 Tax=Gluconobacter japonicus TaxID=376620 RepID=UPI0039E764A5